MPTNYFQPLDGLRNLPGTAFQGSKVKTGFDGGQDNLDSPWQSDEDALNLLSLQTQRRDELARNAAKGLTMAAPEQSMDQLNSDISSNPITQQGNEVRDYLGNLREANVKGFSTPQEQSAYGRNIEAEKMRQPLEIAKTAGEYGLRGRELENTGNLAVEQERTRGYQDRTESTNNMALLKQLLSNQGRSDLATGDNVSKQLADLERLHTVGVSGKRMSDEDYIRRKGEIQAQGQGSQQGGGTVASNFARRLRQDYPNASAAELLDLARNPNNSMGGIDDPEDLRVLEQYLRSLGAQ